MLLPIIMLIILIKETLALAIYEINQRVGKRDLLYGDVLLSPKQMQLRRYNAKGSGKLIRHIAVKQRANNRWPNNKIPYIISDKYFDTEKEKLLNAIKVLEKNSCFKFIPQTDQIDYLFIEKMEGCFSFVGRIGGKQMVSLASGCLYDYIIWHELMHALGLEHEHQRPDRDRFIRIRYENVDPDKLLNFEVIPATDVDLYHGYDYASIMHYDGRAFGRFDPITKRPMVTMEPIKPNIELLDNVLLTAMDSEKLIILGRCSHYPSRSSKILHEAYRAKHTSYQQSNSQPSDTSENNSIEATKDPFDRSATNKTVQQANTQVHISTDNSKKSCSNRSNKCSHFNHKGYCKNYHFKRLMLLYCPVSCGYCEIKYEEKTYIQLNPKFFI